MNVARIRISLVIHRKSEIWQQLFVVVNAAKQASTYFGKWKLPEGYDSGICVYNSAANQKVPLILKNKNLATWYMCGPTVYAESHIGHASCYVKCDIVRRIMENVFNIDVLLLMGITDIDDKIIKRAKEVGLTTAQLSRQYELDFFKDMAAMEVQLPAMISRVSESLPLIISFCQKLIEKEYAYVTEEGNVYFMVSKGVSADIINQLPDDPMVTDPLKKDHRDFALWKAAKPDEPYWMSPWGKGRPGWHIECSAMASHVFGSQLDIHSGGYDLLFPHHTNEKSQSEAYHGCPQWGNYWLHSGLLQIGDDVKMSKSLGNTISIKDFLKQNFVNDFRILCLQSPYRKNVMYNEETLKGATALHKKLHTFINESELYISGKLKVTVTDENKLISKLNSTKQQVISLLSDDFNTSQALLCITDLIDEVNRSLKLFPHSSESSKLTAVAACFSYVNRILEIFGVNIICRKRLPKDFIYVMDTFTEFRNQLRLLALQRDPGSLLVENCTSSEYIENAYKDLNQKLCLIKVNKELNQIFNNISDATSVLYGQSLDFVKTLDQTESDPLILQKTSKDKTKIIKPILTYCDEFRLSLEKSGIGIKDRIDVSTWIPLIGLQHVIQLKSDS